MGTINIETFPQRFWSILKDDIDAPNLEKKRATKGRILPHPNKIKKGGWVCHVIK